MIASVAKAYFNERYAEESMALAQRVLKSREQTYRLTQLKHQAGVVSAVDLRQQEALIESAKADYASAVQSKEQASNALAILLNQPIPTDLPKGLALSKQFKVNKLPAGLSSDVLLNRPDIRARTRFKTSQCQYWRSACSILPEYQLNQHHRHGFNRTELGLFRGSNRTWTFAPSINIPIFQLGQLTSQPRCRQNSPRNPSGQL